MDDLETYRITLRYDGLDAEKHELDLYALGESMQASQQRLYQQNPTLYNQMWTGFKE